MNKTQPSDKLIMNQEQLSIKQARELWSLAFPDDSDVFKDWFFATQYPHLPRWCTWEKDKLLSVVYAMPYTLVCRGKSILSPLILGVSTHPEARYRGLMRDLLQNVHQDLAQTCAAVCLHPFNFDFYHKLGYSVVSEHVSVRLAATALSSCQPSGFVNASPDFSQLAQINQHYAQRMGFFAIRDSSLLARRFADLQTGGGFCIMNEQAYAFVDPPDTPSKICRLSEFAYTNLSAGCSLLAFLAQSVAASQLIFTLAVDDVGALQKLSCTPISSCELTHHPFLMLKDLNLPALVTGMRIPLSRSLRRVLHILDDDTRWQITIGAGIATLSPTKAPGDVSLTHNQVMRWICGYSDAETLATEGVAQADCLSFLPKLSAFFFDMY